VGWVVFRVSKRGWRYSRNRIGKAGDPCGMPMLIGHWMSVWPSNERAVVLFARNDLTHESTAFRHPSCDMVWSRQADDTLSNVPLTSRNRADITCLVPTLVSVLCMSAIATSIAEYWGQPQIWSGCSRWWASAIYTSLVAINVSSILPMQLSRASRRYAFTEL
jgi:hypothetical protein